MVKVIIPVVCLFAGIMIGGITANKVDVPFIEEEKEEQVLEVKKSLTGLCHPKGSQFFDYIIHYEPYDSMSECVLDGGRVPKRVEADVRNIHNHFITDSDIIIAQ